MTALQSVRATGADTHKTTDSAEPSRLLVLCLAIGAGSAVASIYYAQPVLNLIGGELGIGAGSTGLIPTLTQIGYALGILFLLPLGDRFDRRSLIVIKSLALALVLGVSSFSQNLDQLLITSLLIGILATIAQDIVPAAAILSPEKSHGKTIGTVMTGLLTGILLSRTVSGVIGEYFGWRVVMQLAAVEILIVGLMLRKMLPRFATHSDLGYFALLKSLMHLWVQHPTLRRAAIAQALLAVAFSAFWSTLALILADRYGYGSDVAGAFGLLGAAGALMARYAGALSDKHGPHFVTRIGAALVVVFFALMGTVSVLPITGQLVVLAIGTVGFDLGFQTSLVAHQSLVYRIAPEARSRLNAILFSVIFIGMAAGSTIGTQFLSFFGFYGVVGLCVLAGSASLLIRLYDGRAR